MEDEKLLELARNLMRHFVFTEIPAFNGTRQMEIVIGSDSRKGGFWRIVEAKPDEANTFGMDALLLNEYLKQPEQEIFKSRLPSIGKR
jgi:hypothetical protein